MIKSFILTSILVCTASFAQHKPIFGINAGATYANIRGNEVADQNEYDFNFLVGGSIEIPINEHLSFLGNLNYERKTFQKDINFSSQSPTLPIPSDPNFSGGYVNVKVRLEYITIPLNLKFYIDSQKKFFLNGGPFVGVFLNSNSKVNGKSIDENANGIFKTLDFGGNLGVGTRVKITEKYSLNFELRHNYGLANVSDVPVVNNGSVKTNSFNLIANWQFD